MVADSFNKYNILSSALIPFDFNFFLAYNMVPDSISLHDNTVEIVGNCQYLGQIIGMIGNKEEKIN